MMEISPKGDKKELQRQFVQCIILIPTSVVLPSTDYTFKIQKNS